jgi:H+/Cl- antiporter ClcA
MCVSTGTDMRGWGRLVGFVLAKRGEIAVFAAYLCMVSTFAVAYLHPSRSALVAVDAFNEANLELLLILASLPAAARFIVRSLGARVK